MSSSEPPTPAPAPTEDAHTVQERKRKAKEHKQKVGKANFEAAKAAAGVDGLSALKKTEEGQEWLESLVPKEAKEGAELDAKLNEIVEGSDLNKRQHFKNFQALLKDARKFFDEKRIKIYVAVLNDKTHGAEARRQLCTLAGILDNTFKQGYANIFQTWIKVGDKDALDEWTAWANEESLRLKENIEKMGQAVNDMGELYKQACNTDLTEDYDTFFEHVAEQTGGKFVRAPRKTPMRGMEKTAFKKDEDTRWKCENVYDVQRGSISYPTMEGVKAGAEMICNSVEFEVLRLNDRLTEGKETSSGWRDVMLNGRFDGLTHVVEIQLHHDQMVSIREDLGGHYLYSIFRSIVEALEVVLGKEQAHQMIAEHAPKENASEPNGENGRLQEENGALKAAISKKNADIDKLSDEIVKLNNAKNTLEAKNANLQDENESLKKQILQGSSSSSTKIAPADDQWHVSLLEWFRKAGSFTDASVDDNGKKRFEPRCPKSKEDLLELTALRLWGCNITGEIPVSLGNCIKLEWLNLSSNKLEGQIPESLGECIKLKALSLHTNQLEGEIPVSLGNCVNLTQLFLNVNKLEDTAGAKASLAKRLPKCYISV